MTWCGFWQEGLLWGTTYGYPTSCRSAVTENPRCTVVTFLPQPHHHRDPSSRKLSTPTSTLLSHRAATPRQRMTAECPWPAPSLPAPRTSPRSELCIRRPHSRKLEVGLSAIRGTVDPFRSGFRNPKRGKFLLGLMEGEGISTRWTSGNENQESRIRRLIIRRASFLSSFALYSLNHQTSVLASVFTHQRKASSISGILSPACSLALACPRLPLDFAVFVGRVLESDP